MSVVLTARERARREVTSEILAAARRQLGEVGAAALSVRAVARELGLASSAVYRYFATRDELLTALIVEAYDSSGDAVERACAAGGERTPRDRFVAGCRALRDWARTHPHEYALVYGSPVPGYRGNEKTTAAGSRSPLALLAVLADRAPHSAGHTGSDSDAGEKPKKAKKGEKPKKSEQPAGLAPTGSRPLSALLEEQAGLVVAEGGERLHGMTPEVVVAGARAWTALLGLVSSELFGQLGNTFDPADDFSEVTFAGLADDLGL
ncbi:transcriptional regulator, TetR family [Quadrisphaera granulorum]|uniref:TetR family transcriptional regulator n=1 Tax=Quadrisphaera granulorum TaxID=317664 RepID=A0A316AT20_9ACTN|nr:WHG domain-containing protein [Quadrisphaera granulorum]PWJ53257.1 TetR family transcriptional regulator [Quadrisphaera granulorum]SZE96931.1 transcriptional regulator, TetR family [Quadrisphaera granulorum]